MWILYSLLWLASGLVPGFVYAKYFHVGLRWGENELLACSLWGPFTWLYLFVSFISRRI